MNLFSLSVNDQSLFYLGQIFGNISGVLPAANAPLLLGVMFKVLNTGALSVGAMIVVYTTVAGLLSTASEGEFLGKKWSSLWVPVRTVLGIVGLFPFSGGYCAIQVIIMWLILQGVGLADTLWTSVLVFMQKSGGSPYASVSFPDEGLRNKTALQNLFTGLVCYESLAAKYESTGKRQSSDNPYSYRCMSEPQNSFCGAPLPAFDPMDKEQSYRLGYDCGTLTFCNAGVPDPQTIDVCKTNANSEACITKLRESACYKQDSLGCFLCQAQLQVLPSIITTLDNIAKKFVELDYQYQKFYETSSAKTVSTTSPWIQDFCNAQGRQDKCCVNAVSDKDGNSACSGDLFASYPPDAPISGGFNDPATASPNAVKGIYAPYGILPYTDEVNFITAATNQYVGALSAAYTNYITTLPPTQLASWQVEAKNNGWILAGMYYFTIAKANASAQVSISNLPNFNVTVKSPATDPESHIRNYRNNIDAMTPLFEAIGQANGGGEEFSGLPSSAAAPIKSMAAGTASLIRTFMYNITGASQTNNTTALATNALYNISSYGYNIMWSTQLLAVATAVIAGGIALGIAASGTTILGTGIPSAPVLEMVKAWWGIFSPFWILMIVALFSIGALLGIYLPLIPYTIFLMGAVGWLMATIEAMVAGPVIALGILSPSGQHEILGKAEPAVMIIFNLILRPALMVFGMMTSMLLGTVAVTLINQSFARVAFAIIPLPGIAESVIFMCAYTSLLMMVLNKVFSLIHVVPEKVLTYIGGQAISYGESEGLAGMKQAMEGSAAAMTGAGKEGGGALAGAPAKTAQEQKLRAHHAEEAAKQGQIQVEQAADLNEPPAQGRGRHGGMGRGDGTT